MSIHITPDLCESVYNMLKMTMPFKRWKLPDSDDVVFHVVHTSARCGQWWIDEKGNHNLLISSKKHETLDSVIKTMAHEMAHIFTMKERAHHGWQWRKAADLICKYHIWDRGAF